jgi:acetyltransferase-like isoleucine patch superfamily enzyme
VSLLNLFKPKTMSLTQFAWKTYLRLMNPTCTIKSASLSRSVKLEKGITLEYGTHIQTGLIGKYTYINKYSLVDKNTQSIGRFCSIAYGVKIGLGHHPVEWVSTHHFAYDKKYGFVNESKNFDGNTEARCIIGNDVWIGANSIILAGVKIGDGAIVGANSLVTKDVEPYSIVIGSPAKFHRYRFEEDIQKELLNIQWWNWEDKRIMDNIRLFDNPEKLISSLRNQHS